MKKGARVMVLRVGVKGLSVGCWVRVRVGVLGEGVVMVLGVG